MTHDDLQREGPADSVPPAKLRAETQSRRFGLVVMVALVAVAASAVAAGLTLGWMTALGIAWFGLSLVAFVWALRSFRRPAQSSAPEL